MRRAECARQRLQLFKPQSDSRYSADHVASHNQTLFKAVPVTWAQELLALVEPDTEVVGLDKGQFFSADLVEVASQLADAGKRVVIAGLDTDWRGRPFGPMPALMAIAEVVNKQAAICMVCGKLATRTQRLVAAREDILVGSTEAYEARCRLHFDPELSVRIAAPVRSAPALSES